jgi:hypothetical protein
MNCQRRTVVTMMFSRKQPLACVLVFLLVFIHPGSFIFAHEPRPAGGAALPGGEEKPITTKDPQPDRPIEMRVATGAFHAPDFQDAVSTSGSVFRLPVATKSASANPQTSRRFAANGRFVLAAIPEYQGPMAAAFPQEPVPGNGGPAAEAKKRPSLKKWILIAAAGAAAGVVILATQSGSDSDSDGSNPTITAGPPTVGAP